MRILIWTALALAVLTAGCQSGVTPQYEFKCTFRAYDAGLCDRLDVDKKQPG